MSGIIPIIIFILSYISMGSSFTKYGRSCKDIGCPGNQECVMQTDPCSIYQRQGECGAFPTCKRKGSSGGQRDCSNYVCPPSQVCQMDGGTPKCINDASKSGHVGYDTHAANSPSAPPAEGAGGNLYPQVPTRGETTPRPNMRPIASGGSGYAGGQIGSGYPGGYQQPSGNGYPQSGGGYPQQQGGGGYQQPPQYPYGYPGQGSAGYPAGGYQAGYPNNGYNPYQQQYPQKSSGTSITDKIKDGLKTIGLLYIVLSYYLARNFHL